MSRTAAITALLLVPSLALAGKVKTYTASALAHYDKAQIQNVVVTSDGAVRLARSLKPLPAALDATRIWDVIEDKAGNLFVATGDEGKIFKITSDGKVTVAYDSEDSQILCLVATADGTIFAGTGPSGLIVRIDPTGNATVLHDSPEKYVWGLAYDEKEKTLYAATGPREQDPGDRHPGQGDCLFPGETRPHSQFGPGRRRHHLCRDRQTGFDLSHRCEGKDSSVPGPTGECAACT